MSVDLVLRSHTSTDSDACCESTSLEKPLSDEMLAGISQWQKRSHLRGKGHIERQPWDPVRSLWKSNFDRQLTYSLCETGQDRLEDNNLPQVSGETGCDHAEKCEDARQSHHKLIDRHNV